MTFCGRCGHELPTADGRFCGRCGHETVRGNARYPLYADGSAAVTRRRPRVVADAMPEAERTVERAAERTAVRAGAAEHTVVRTDPGVTRPRLPIALFDTGAGLSGLSVLDGPGAAGGVHRRSSGGPDAGAGDVLPSSRWGVAMLTTLAVMLVVAVLGGWLMLH